MKAQVRVDSDTVAIGSVTPHPENPRRGDVSVIAESLTVHGQYRPIVVQRSTGHVIAGNHTYRAARSLGWRKIAVTYVDCTDEDAARIMLADNRSSDLATYDDGALVELLRSLPDLAGTGFDEHDLTRLEELLDSPVALSDEPAGAEPGTPAADDLPQIRLGDIQLRVDPEMFTPWTEAIAQDRHRRDVVADLRARLGLAPIRTEIAPAPERHADTSRTVPIDTVHPYPRNARQGDIGAISESLRVLGQYRPIVVNEPTGEILVGNHTWQAARALGWTEIAVTYISVNPDQAARIVAVDNRTSDLAGYDDDTLAQMLTSLASTDGTGYTPADIDDLLHVTARGGTSRRPAPSSRISCSIGDWRWKNTHEEWTAWTEHVSIELADDTIHAWIATAINLPDGIWTPVKD